MMPALRAPLCCSPIAGRQKLAGAQTVWRLITLPAVLLGGIKRGAANVHVHVSGTRFPEEPLLLVILLLLSYTHATQWYLTINITNTYGMLP